MAFTATQQHIPFLKCLDMFDLHVRKLWRQLINKHKISTKRSNMSDIMWGNRLKFLNPLSTIIIIKRCGDQDLFPRVSSKDKQNLFVFY